MNRTSSPPEWVEITVIKALWAYIPLVLLLATFIGNSCTVFILLRKNVRNRRGTVYLLCLVVVDVVAICTGSLVSKWVEFGLGKSNRFSPRCNIVQDYINRVARTVATFLMVSMTVERVISVWLPFIASRRCKRRVAYIDLVVIFLFTATFYSHVLFGTWIWCPGVEVTQCPADWPSNHTALSRPVVNTNCRYVRFTVDIFPLLDAAVNSYLPLAVVIVGDVAVAYRVLVKTKLVLFTSARDGEVKKITGVGRRKASRMTQLTTLLNAVYFMTALPLAIQLTIQKTMERNFYQSRRDAQMALSWAVTVLVMYARAALDFPILLALCPLFRAECKAVVALLHLHVCTLCRSTVLQKVLSRSVTPGINPKLRSSLSATKGGTTEYTYPALTNRGTTEISFPAATDSSSSSSHSTRGYVHKPPLHPVEEGEEEATPTRDRSLLTSEERPSSGSFKMGALSASMRKKQKAAFSTIKVLNRFVWDEPFNVRSATPSMMTESPDVSTSRGPGFLFTISHGIAPALKTKWKVTPIPAVSLRASSPKVSSSVIDAESQTDLVIMHEVAKMSSPSLLQRASSPSASKDLDLPGGSQVPANVSASLSHTGSGCVVPPSVRSPASTSRYAVPCIAEEETPLCDVSDNSSCHAHKLTQTYRHPN